MTTSAKPGPKPGSGHAKHGLTTMNPMLKTSGGRVIDSIEKRTKRRRCLTGEHRQAEQQPSRAFTSPSVIFAPGLPAAHRLPGAREARDRQPVRERDLHAERVGPELTGQQQ